MRKPLSRSFKDERPRLEVGFIAKKKAGDLDSRSPAYRAAYFFLLARYASSCF